MLNLIKNEYIKTLNKTSTMVVLVLIVITAIGFGIVSKWAVSEGYYYIDDDYVVDYTYEIEYARANKFFGYKLQIEKFEFLMDNNISYYSQWKNDIVNEAFAYIANEEGEAEYILPEAEKQKLTAFVKNSDWKGYYQYLIDTAKAEGAAPEEYWEYQYRIDNDFAPAEKYSDMTNWKNTVISSVASAKSALADPLSLSPEEKAAYEETVALGIYRLNNNIAINVGDHDGGLFSDTVDIWNINFWTIMFTTTSLITIIGLLMILIAGASVSSEFSAGTIKFLLINPVKRWKILASKYFTCISIGYIMLFIFLILCSIMTIIFFGASDLNAAYLTIVDGAVKSTPGWLHLLKSYMLASVSCVVMTTIAFTLSSLTKSTALAIGASVFAMLSGETVVMFLKLSLKQDWARYLVFANMNIASVANGNSMFAHHSVSFAVTVVVVHMIVFLLTAWDAFTKRDI